MKDRSHLDPVHTSVNKGEENPILMEFAFKWGYTDNKQENKHNINSDRIILLWINENKKYGEKCLY